MVHGIVPRKHGNCYVMILARIMGATKPDTKVFVLEQGRGWNKRGCGRWAVVLLGWPEGLLAKTRGPRVREGAWGNQEETTSCS